MMLQAAAEVQTVRVVLQAAVEVQTVRAGLQRPLPGKVDEVRLWGAGSGQ